MKYTNEMKLPLSLVSAIVNDTYSKGNADISVTTLIGPPKIRVLAERYKDVISEDVADCIYRLVGSNTHAILERIGHKNALQEERLFLKVGGWIISGQADLYEDEIVHDYKNTSVWTILRGAKPEWINQLNCYAHGFRHAKFRVKGLKVIAILRDWSKHKVRASGNYPRKQVVTLEAPLWSNAEAQEYIEGRVVLHKAADALKDDDIPPCSPEERWDKPTQYAVVKGSLKGAWRVVDELDEAKKLKAEIEERSGNKYRIDERVGSSVRCENYCSVNEYCHYYRAIVPF